VSRNLLLLLHFSVCNHMGITFKLFPYDCLNFIGDCCNIPFLSLILLIWVFLLHFLFNLARSLLILFIFSKNQLFVLLIHYIGYLVSNSLISALIFIISFCLLLFGFFCYYFSRSLRCISRLFIWDLSSFLMWALMV
jgi:hypothetical protein